jgi:cytosine/adenosine deaminase-related metal-dependent hydrolase
MEQNDFIKYICATKVLKMRYLKFKADQIFDGYQLLDSDSVLITDEAGKIVEIVHSNNAGDDIQELNGILCPGFVNAHCHLELSHLKGKIAEHTGLVDFVKTVMKTRSEEKEVKEQQMVLAYEEMFRSGIVAVGDICNTTDSIAIKAKSAIHWHNFIEVSGFDVSQADKRMMLAREMAQAFASLSFPFSITPHAPYSVSANLFEQINDKSSSDLLSVHNQECAAENELFLNKSGDFLTLYKNFGIPIASFSATQKSSVQSWLPYFTQHQSVILVHNTFTDAADIDFILANSTIEPFFCVCINANKYIEQRTPPIELLREKKATIVLGTDSYASNWHLNILSEIKAIQSETKHTIPLSEVLQWATLNGATALRMQDQIGSFEKGKTPGLVLISGIEEDKIVANSFSERIL